MVSSNRFTRGHMGVALAFCLPAASGCSDAHDGAVAQKSPVVIATPVIAEASAIAADATATAAATSPEGNATAIGSAAESREEAKPSVAEYQAPFPDRVDLFVPPKRQGGVRVDGDVGDAVDLVGFIRLDRQQAVLSINGQVTRIAEGASQDGVEVISIHPPSVVLQRGRQRWQDSLDN